jgi:hypothetical protein
LPGWAAFRWIFRLKGKRDSGPSAAKGGFTIPQVSRKRPFAEVANGPPGLGLSRVAEGRGRGSGHGRAAQGAFGANCSLQPNLMRCEMPDPGAVGLGGEFTRGLEQSCVHCA